MPNVAVGTDVRPISVGSRILRGALAGLVLTGLSNVFLFVGHLIIPRILSKTDYAEFSVSVGFVSLVALVADLGMNALLTRLFAEAEEDFQSGVNDRRGAILGSMLLLRFVLALVVAALVLGFGRMFYSELMVSNFAIVLLTLLISSRLFVLRSVGECALRSQGKYYIVAFLGLIDAIVFASLLVYGKTANLSLSGILWIYSLSNLPGMILLFLILRVWVKRQGIVLRLDAILTGEVLRTLLPLTLTTVFLTVHSQIDALLLDKLSSQFEVSNYAATIRLLAATAPIPVVLATVIAPELTRLLRGKDYKLAKQLMDLTLRFLLVISIGLALLLSAGSHEIVNTLLGFKYVSAAPLLPWIGWMFVPVAIGAVIAEANNAAGHFWYPPVYTGVLMVVVIVGDLLLIGRFGALGAVVSKLSAVTVGGAVLVYITRKAQFFNYYNCLRSFLQAGISAGIATLVGVALVQFGTDDLLRALATVVSFLILIHLTGLITWKEVLQLLKKTGGLRP